MFGRLNSFQTAMLQWNSMHPYNAVHVVKLPEKLDAERLSKAVNGSLEKLGLTGLSLHRRDRTYSYRGGASAYRITTLSDSSDVMSVLSRETERQLNTPFPDTDDLEPFRFFVVDSLDAFFLGLVYFHAIADAESVVMALKEIAFAYMGEKERRATKVELYPPGRANLLRAYPMVLAKKIGNMPSMLRELRRSSRPRYRDPMDLSNVCVIETVTSQNLRFLVSLARSARVTLNDLLLACLMKIISNFPSAKSRGGRRSKISVGCIVNARRDLLPDGPHIFGLFLGSFIVTHEVPRDMGLVQLAENIRKQTLSIKENKLYLGAEVELGLNRLILPWFSAERRKKFYQKNYPLWGGITNMNLNSLWPQEPSAKKLDYFRAVSTGPATPLVLSLTTVGEAANVGITYRRTAFSPEDIEAVSRCFRDPQGHVKAWS
jgi:NRPS condensation-like uncharacterized protein